MFDSKRNTLFIILAGFFVTNAIVAEMIGSKLISVYGIPMSLGILPWPIVFIVTDLLNEFYGKSAVRKLSFITAGLISFVFAILFISIHIPAAKGEGFITDEQFNSVFGQSNLIIIGSIVAFLISQLFDSFLFKMIKDKTGEKYIWFRSTGSTVISQLIDSFIVAGIAFYLPGIWSTQQYVESSLLGYSVKLGIAILLTPLIYITHFAIKKYLKNE